jgi:hypothetical protein
LGPVLGKVGTHVLYICRTTHLHRLYSPAHKTSHPLPQTAQIREQKHTLPSMSLPFDQVSYLFLCIQHAGGKIDFGGVAQDYERIHGQKLSKVAAEKRFARLKVKMQDMGMGGSTKGSCTTPSPKKRKSDDDHVKSTDKKIKKEIKEEDNEN